MIISLFFAFFLILENLLLPSLIGPKIIIITQIFLLSIFIFGKKRSAVFIQAGIFSAGEEFFLGMRLGTIFIPIFITGLFYLWINNFIEFRSGLQDSSGFRVVIIAGIVLAFLYYLYSWIYIYIGSSFNAMNSLVGFMNLLDVKMIIGVFLWSGFSCLLWKYVLYK